MVIYELLSSMTFMNQLATRAQSIQSLFPGIPAFRHKQITAGLFQREHASWADCISLPAQMRAELSAAIPWMSIRALKIFESRKKDTYKAALELADGKRVETVLMNNRRNQWTICVSSQAGCAMRCSFCATGKMGLSRSLNADEITDQYRFWAEFLRSRPDLPQRISNVVFMGMGEPLANYFAVTETIKNWLAHTDLGPTHITVSTVGVIPLLERILQDATWPGVRLAISLHSADPATRKQIVPSSYDDFLPRLADWARAYIAARGNRRHHITFEHVMLSRVNDTPHHARVLAQYVNSIGDVRVNLIPYNFTADSGFTRTTDTDLANFKSYLESHGVTTTVRKTMGDDIAAACGQLITDIKKAEVATATALKK